MAEPTYFTAVLASVAGANKHHLSLWNGAGSGKTLKIHGIYATGAPTAAVSGLVIPLHAIRISTIPTGGSVLAFGKAAAADAALPAQIEARAAPTGGATEVAPALGVGTVSGEETVAPYRAALYEFAINGGKPVELAPGEGLSVRQGALASAGAIHVLVRFTAV